MKTATGSAATWRHRLVLILLLGCAAFACAAARAACTAPAPGLTPIHAVVAGGTAQAHIRGVVTAVFPGLHGYFIEASRADWDGNAATSEALFVYTGHDRVDVAPGDQLVLAGHFLIYHGMPELEHAHVLARCGRTGLPPAITLDLPLERSGGWEGLLGMRVRFAQPLYVTGLHDAWHYGEVLLATGGRLLAPTELTVPGPGAAAIARAKQARSLWLDDGSTRVAGSRLDFAGHRFDPAHPLRDGQQLKDLAGIVLHAFGRNLLEPTAFKFDAAANPRRMPDQLGLPPGLRIVTFNVENYFNHAVNGPAFPTERGARDATDFACQTRKLLAALTALHPALAGLQEIENDGYGAKGAITHLVAALNRANPSARYSYIRPPVPRLGDDLIAPALVYDSRLLAPAGRVAVLDVAGGRHAPDSAAATGLARPALAVSFRMRATGLVFTAAVVHLRSKRDACGGGLDNYDGAGHCALARAAAISPLLRWLDSRPTGAATDNLLLLGDFNAYPKEAAIENLREAGWVDLVARHVPGRRRYTESYRGRAGELDYFFANPAMAGYIADTAIWHSDSDEARAFAYDGRLPECKTPWRASDHDPVIAVLKP